MKILLFISIFPPPRGKVQEMYMIKHVYKYNVNCAFNNGRRSQLLCKNTRFTALGLKPITTTGVRTNITPA